MALGLTLPAALAADPVLLAAAVIADLAVGDPSYPAHPVRLMGRTLASIEGVLRRVGADGYGGGIALFLALAATWAGATSALVLGAAAFDVRAGRIVHLFLLYSLLALGDLLRHGWNVERALRRGDLAAGRAAVSHLVGRDTDRMDEGACRRAVIESWSENLTDGFTSAIFWYALGGLPGLVVFKVVSTMDSMVGYKTPRYLRFGWCGARLDDAMNYVPARLTWLLLSAAAAIVTGCSASQAARIGLAQHARMPSPNSGWTEAAAAGAIRRRLAGPIWMGGTLVTDIWLGHPGDPPASQHEDVARASNLIVAGGVLASVIAIAALAS